MARDQLGINRSDDWYVCDRLGKGQVNRCEPPRHQTTEGVRPPCPNQSDGEEHRQARREKVDCDTRDQLVSAECDGGDTVHDRQ